MKVRALLDVLHIAERLKDELRHCETSRGRRESVAEHSWRLALMAMLAADAFPDLDMDSVTELAALYTEMGALQTDEAKLYKALDKLEAVIQHNESDIRSWEPLEYDLNRTYAYDAVAFSPYLTKLREAIREDTEEKIKAAEK